MGFEHLVTIGQIAGVHGLKGWLKVRSYAESPDLLPNRQTIIVETPAGDRAVYDVEWARPHSKGFLMALGGVTCRSDAERLKGALLQIEKSDLPEPEADAFYWADLIGMTVFTHQGIHLGELVSIIETGSNDVFVVVGDSGEVLIPALASVVLEVDVENKRMQVELPEGL